MPDPNLFRLRATYCKQGRLALLSHLEVARALERAVRRAGLPFAVSQGFSPHMKIAFGAALPVGGTCELFDLQMTRYVPPDEVLEALQGASVPDLMVKACSYIGPHDAAASAAYPVGTYRALLSRAVGALSVPATVTVVRKKKERTLSVAEFLVGEPELSGAVLTFSLESKPTGSLRPDVLLRLPRRGGRRAAAVVRGERRALVCGRRRLRRGTRAGAFRDAHRPKGRTLRMPREGSCAARARRSRRGCPLDRFAAFFGLRERPAVRRALRFDGGMYETRTRDLRRDRPAL